MSRFYHYINHHPNWACFLAGLLLNLAFAPVFFLPAIFTLNMLLLVSDQNRSIYDACRTGFWFGMGYFLGISYWVSIALFIDIARYIWLLPISLLGLAAYLSLNAILLCILLYLLPTRGLARILFFAVTWVLTELVRGSWVMYFPWNLLGHVWADWLPIMQTASLIGSYGLSLLTCIIALLPYVWLHDGYKSSSKNIYLAVTCTLLLLSFCYGKYRLNAMHDHIQEDTYIHIIQPNISQKEKMSRDMAKENMSKLLSLSKQALSNISDDGYHYIIWPESALPYISTRNNYPTSMLQDVVPSKGAILAGGVSVSGYKNNKFWASMFFMDKDNVTAIYDKKHLVPYGEYIPLRWLMPNNLQKLTLGEADFSHGEGPSFIKLPNYATMIRPLVCYEVIFADEIILDKPAPARWWMVNITNDAWYGNSSGPYQHLYIASMRAVEYGVPLIRGTNNGISAVIDSYGRILASLPLNNMGVLSAKLPPTVGQATIYSVYGNKIVFVLMVLMAVFGLRIANGRPSS